MENRIWVLMLFLEDNRVVQGFFANGRIDRETLPSGWYAYDLGEGETGEICKIANSGEMDLDHYDTFCCKENLWLGKDGLTLAKVSSSIVLMHMIQSTTLNHLVSLA